MLTPALHKCSIKCNHAKKSGIIMQDLQCSIYTTEMDVLSSTAVCTNLACSNCRQQTNCIDSDANMKSVKFVLVSHSYKSVNIVLS